MKEGAGKDERPFATSCGADNISRMGNSLDEASKTDGAAESSEQALALMVQRLSEALGTQGPAVANAIAGYVNAVTANSRQPEKKQEGRAESSGKLPLEGLPQFMTSQEAGGKNSFFIKFLELADKIDSRATRLLDGKLRELVLLNEGPSEADTESKFIDVVYAIGEHIIGILNQVQDQRTFLEKIGQKGLSDDYDAVVAWETALNTFTYGKCMAFLPLRGASYRSDEMMGTSNRNGPVQGYTAWGVKGSKGSVVMAAQIIN